MNALPATPVRLSAPGAYALAGVPALLVLAVLWRPVWDVDIFWQLKLGELILARHGPVLHEPFAASHPGAPLPALAWLGQAVMAGVRLWTGWNGLRLFNALCWAGAFLLSGQAALRRGQSPAAVAIAMVAALLVSVPGASIRPQTLGMLAFGALIWLVDRPGRAAGRVIAGAGLLVLWQNLHPSVAVGAAWLGARAAAAWWLARRSGQTGHRAAEVTLLALIAGAALLATPDGAGFVAVARDNAAISQALRVSEWLPLWAPENRVIAALVLGITALTLTLPIARPRARGARRGPADLALVLPWLVLLALTLVSARIMLFWAVALVPVLAAQLPRLEGPRPPRGTGPAAALVTGLLVIALRPTAFAPTLPVAQLDALYRTGTAGTVFAHFPWGGAVVDRGYPRWRVAYDGRYYRYGVEEWNRYIALGSGRLGLAETERVYRPAAYVLDAAWTPRLVAELRARPRDWRQLPESGPAVIFVRRGR